MNGKAASTWCVILAVVGAPAAATAQDVLEKCPREHLRAVYLQAVERHDVVDLAAVEVEVLKLCRERQELIREIVRGEQELDGLLAEGAGAAGTRRPDSGTGSAGLPGLLPAAEFGERGAANAAAPATLPLASTRSGQDGHGTPAYRWFTVYGSGSALVAGVTDGVGRWWVRAGDRLPGGVEVVSVGVRPISVRAAAGKRQWQLAGPGGLAPQPQSRSEMSP